MNQNLQQQQQQQPTYSRHQPNSIKLHKKFKSSNRRAKQLTNFEAVGLLNAFIKVNVQDVQFSLIHN